MSENSKIEQRVVIKFFTKLGKGPSEIDLELRKVYGDSTLPISTIKRWAADFKRGRENFEDDPRSGRPPTAVTDENVAKIGTLVRSDRRIKIKEIEREVPIGRAAIHFILHEKLGLSKVCARWVPRLLSNEQK
jgi:transposase